MTSGDLSLTIVALLAVTFLFSHAGLFVLARRFNVLLVLATAYLMLSPASAAPELPLSSGAKLARVYVTVLMLLLALTVVRIHAIRPLSTLYLAFIAFFTASALWSSLPMDAMKYKGLYALVVLSGLFTAYSIQRFDDLTQGLRMFALAGSLFVLFIMVQVVSNPEAISRIGRLAAWGMNGNRIGQTAAPLLTVCAYLALHDPGKLWKVLGYGTGVMLGLIIIYTGSRGAAMEALIGCFVVGIPLLRRPARFALVLAFFAVTAVVAYRYGGAEEGATERFFDTSLQSREDPWTEGMRYFREAPVTGNGWVTHEEAGKGESTQNFHSIFMQVLVEAGVVGLTLFISLWLVIIAAAFRVKRQLRRMKGSSPAIYLINGLLFAILIHGFFEAGSMTGSLVDSLLLPFCIGLFARLPVLERARLRAMSGESVATRQQAMLPGGQTSAAGA